MDTPSFERSRAEALYAQLLERDPHPSADVVRELGGAHPELAAELDLLHAQIGPVQGLLAGWAAPDAVDARPPDLGEFRCLRLLGRGGMGEVWEAQDKALGRPVAVKLMREHGGVTEAQLRRFRREAQAAGRVQHPGIVAVHQIGSFDGRSFIVQELVAGGRTLRDEIEELRRAADLPADHARRIARRFAILAEGLAAAHEAGIVHRDLKPQNVLLTREDEPKVSDFGLALLASDASLAPNGEFMGTYLYASPEQILGAGSAVTASSDVFSLGATLYENLTLRRAFDGDSVQEISRAVTSSDPPAPHLVRRRVPRDLSLVCMKALEKRPADRYASMAELAQDLARFLAHEPTRARAPSPLRRGLKWIRRHPTIATALGLSFAASAGLAGLFLRSEGLRDAAVRAQDETAAANRSLIAAAEELRIESVSREEALDFLVGMFEKADPFLSADSVPTVRDLLSRAVERLHGGEITDERVRARLLTSLGVVSMHLGDSPLARGLLEQALALWTGLGTGTAFEAVEVELALAVALEQLGETGASERIVETLVARLGLDPAFDARFGPEVLCQLAASCMDRRDFAAAEDALARAQELYFLGPERPDLATLIRLQKADWAFYQGRLDQARRELQTFLDENPEIVARAHPEVLSVINRLGMIQIQEGLLDEAETMFLGLCAEAERTLDPNHPLALLYRMNLARVYEAQTRYPEAEALYREILALLEPRLGPRATGVLTLHNNIAACLFFQRRLTEAEETYRSLWEAEREQFGAGDRFTLRSQHNLARTLVDLGRLDEALELEEDVVAKMPPDDPSAEGRRILLEQIRAALDGHRGDPGE